MPSIVFLTLHRPNRSPSQRFRFEQYILFLEKNGYDCNWSYLLGEEDDIEYYKEGNITKKLGILIRSTYKRWNEYKAISQFDLIFIQRECFMLGTAFFEKRLSKNNKIIFDFDDAVWLQNVSDANKKFGFLKNANKTSSIIKTSHLVIAGNKYLATYAKEFNKNVKVIPTTIDTSNHHNKIKNHIEKPVVTIGWTGSNSTLKYLSILEDTIKEIGKMKKIEFLVISDKKPIVDWENLKFIYWNKKTEIDDLLKIDIGVMPLPDTEWAKGKCGFKILQYQALGIPAVASPVGVNKEIIQEGVNGFLAANTKEWTDKLIKLISNLELRNQMGRKGREIIEKKYSVNANKKLYLKYFDELLSS